MLDLGLEEETAAPVTTAPKKVKAAPKEEMVPLSTVQRMIQEALDARMGGITPDVEEEVKAGEPPPGCSGRKCTIMIDEVEGMSNFEVLGLNGHVLQIKRGEEVDVWEEYVEILRHAVSTSEPTLQEVERGVRRQRNRAAIPWHLIRGAH